MVSKGYVGLFRCELHETHISAFVQSWLKNFDKVEQLVPGRDSGNATFTVSDPAQIMWAPHLQFRVMLGEDFAWVYVSKGGRVVETSGLPYGDNMAPLNALAGLADLTEVIDQENERRLDELEREGVI
ncbi:MAG: hypothetical protein LBD30_02275 [Verrucomicrobiales bacterium]|jgi:hypothetical protein|nr:hypothetical protein [Verrucomicrobiales bacterium]